MLPLHTNLIERRNHFWYMKTTEFHHVGDFPRLHLIKKRSVSWTWDRPLVECTFLDKNKFAIILIYEFNPYCNPRYLKYLPFNSSALCICVCVCVRAHMCGHMCNGSGSCQIKMICMLNNVTRFPCLFPTSLLNFLGKYCPLQFILRVCMVVNGEHSPFPGLC